MAEFYHRILISLCITTRKVKPYGYTIGMGNRQPIATNEWYHCYSRGVDKRIVCIDEDDYERLLVLLYLCNDEDSNTRIYDLELRYVRLSRLLERKSIIHGAPLVEIGAYAFMSNHVHFILKPLSDRGLSRFMQKVFTGYTMYFNKKYERTGSLFSGTYKSKHIDTDTYFKYALQYVLLNPIELFEPRWKTGHGDLSLIKKQLLSYRYASTSDFFGIKRPEGLIVHNILNEYFDKPPSLNAMLRDAQEYYRANEKFLTH